MRNQGIYLGKPQKSYFFSGLDTKAKESSFFLAARPLPPPPPLSGEPFFAASLS